MVRCCHWRGRSLPVLTCFLSCHILVSFSEYTSIYDHFRSKLTATSSSTLGLPQLVGHCTTTPATSTLLGTRCPMASSAAPRLHTETVKPGCGWLHPRGYNSMLRHRQAADLPQTHPRGSEPCHVSRCSKLHRRASAKSPEPGAATSPQSWAKERLAVTSLWRTNSVLRDEGSALWGLFSRRASISIDLL